MTNNALNAPCPCQEEDEEEEERELERARKRKRESENVSERERESERKEEREKEREREVMGSFRHLFSCCYLIHPQQNKQTVWCLLGLVNVTKLTRI